ncbi:hypothetical protein [Streptomyces sp. NPDC020965]|uniref:hypothetical protein n=1 Tax=Streptomyces sp. NPDC020965 TaxID=3365105 RepID=UPI0037B81AEF
MTDSLLAVLPVPMAATLSVAALALLAVSALRLCSAGRTDPSDEARSMTLAVYGCLIALVTLTAFISLL